MRLALIELCDHEGYTLDTRSVPLFEGESHTALVDTMLQAWAEMMLRNPGSTIKVTEFQS
jgi:hypothetical protein